MISMHPALLAASQYGSWPPPYGPPVLYALLPASGPSTGGNYVVLFGQNLGSVTQVLFDTTAATIVYQGGYGGGYNGGGGGGYDGGGGGGGGYDYGQAGGYDYGGCGTMLVVTAPAHAPGTVQVTAVNYSGTSNGLPYTYTPPTVAPTLSSIAPTVGPASGGTLFVINGTGLDSSTTVKFNGVSATVLATTGTQVFGLTPAGPAAGGTVPVAVANSAGPALTTLSFTYYPTPAAPNPTAITPASSVSAGGGTFSITGTNLGSVIGVLFNSTFVTPSSVSAGTVSGTIPSGTVGPATVAVVTTSGTVSLPAGSFSYTP